MKIKKFLKQVGEVIAVGLAIAVIFGIMGACVYVIIHYALKFW